MVLGTRPYGMTQFRSGSSISVFVCSDHPTIIHASNNKILFSTVNLKVRGVVRAISNVTMVCMCVCMIRK